MAKGHYANMTSPKSGIKLRFDPHPLAEYESEIEGVPFVIRLSGHYYTQGDTETHWECYGLRFPGVKASVDEEVPNHIVNAAWKRGHLTALQLQRDMPPERILRQGAESLS